MKSMKKLLLTLLALALALSMLPLGVFATLLDSEGVVGDETGFLPLPEPDITADDLLPPSGVGDETVIRPFDDEIFYSFNNVEKTAVVTGANLHYNVASVPATVTVGRKTYEVIAVAAGAFEDYPALDCAVFHSATVVIDENAFAPGCAPLIMGLEGSTAQAFAAAKGWDFIVFNGVETKLEFYGSSISLQDDFTLEYYVSADVLDCGFTGVKVSFRFLGKIFEAPCKREGDYLVFSFDNIAPQYLGEPVTAVLSAKLGSKPYTVEKTFSVAQYCAEGTKRLAEGDTEWYTAAHNAGTAEDFQRLCMDILYYGAAAQQYVSYKTDALVTSPAVTAGLKEEHLALATPAGRYHYDSVQDAAYRTISSPKATFLGTNLNLSENIALFLYFNTTVNGAYKVVVTDEDGNAVTTVEKNRIGVTPYGYQAKLDMCARDLFRPYLFTVCDENGTPVSDTLRFSAESYVSNAALNAEDDLWELMDRMMNYGAAAMNFSNDVDNAYDYKESLALLPFATSKMTEGQLRSLVVDLMTLQLSLAFTPDASYNHYAGAGADGYWPLNAGTVYGGLPYCNSSYGNIYKAMELYDPYTGTLKVKQFGLSDRGTGVGLAYDIIGAQCSASAFWAWSRVSDGLSINGTSSIVPGQNGTVKLGNYAIDPSKLEYKNGRYYFTPDYNVYTIVEAQKKADLNVLYDAYDQLKPGDGIIFSDGSNGHVRIVTRVDRSDSDRAKWRVYFIDESGSSKTKTVPQSNGVDITYHANGYVPASSTPYYVLAHGNVIYDENGNATGRDGVRYLPFSLPEFHGTDDVEALQLQSDLKKSAVTAEEFAAQTVTSNYNISHATVTVRTSAGREVYRYVYFPVASAYSVKSLQLGVGMGASAYGVGAEGVAAVLKQYEGLGYTVELSVQSAHGEKVLAFSGELVKTAYTSPNVAFTPGETLTSTKLDSFPIANASMTEDQLRDLAFNFFRLSLNFGWKPNSSFALNTGSATRSYTAGNLYGGQPYTVGAYSGLYQAMHYYNESTGVMDTSSMSNVGATMGSHCLSGSYWAWARVSNDIRWGATTTFTPNRGAILLGAVGDAFAANDALSKANKWGNGTSSDPLPSTKDLCDEIGYRGMVQSYALLKHGDGIATSVYDYRHFMMVDYVDVENGMIYVQHQTTGDRPVSDYNGTALHLAPGYASAYSFEFFFERGYVPFTLEVYSDPSKVQTDTTTFSAAGTTELTVGDLLQGKIKSTHAISDVTVEIMNGSAQVAKFFYNLSSSELWGYQVNYHRKSAAIVSLKTDDVHTDLGAEPEDFNDFVGKGYTVKLAVRLANGQKREFTTGKLVSALKDFSYTPGNSVYQDANGQLTPNPSDTKYSLPVATDYMTPDELREIAFQTMNMTMGIKWKTPTAFNTFVGSGDNATVIPHTAGTVYQGMPYSTSSYNSLYTFLHYYNGSSFTVNSVSDLLSQYGNTVTENLGKVAFGNQCSASTAWAWASVSDQVRWTGTSNVLPQFGAYYLGDALRAKALVTYDGDTNFSLSTMEFLKSVGTSDVYAAYKLLQKGDGLVQNYGAVHADGSAVTQNKLGGHVRMVVSVTVSSTLKNSKVTVIEQSGGIRSYTFESLYNNGYIPFTIPEFLPADHELYSPVEKSFVNYIVANDEDKKVTASAVTVRELLHVYSVDSNYPIAALVVQIKNGSAVAKEYFYSTTGYIDHTNGVFNNYQYTYQMRDKRNVYLGDPTEIGTGVPWNWTLGATEGQYTPYADGNHTVIVKAQLSTGELVTVYSGTLATTVVGNTAVTSGITVTDSLVDAIPVASPSTGKYALRDIAWDFMALQLNIGWTGNAAFTSREAADVGYKANTVYGGMPYSHNAFSNLYYVLNYYDNGKMDVAAMNANTNAAALNQGSAGLNTVSIQFSNHCSSSTMWAWARVSDSIQWDGTDDVVPAKGAVILGSALSNYFAANYSSLQNYKTEGIWTKTILNGAGQEAAFEGYAKLQYADGLIMYGEEGGHVRMVYSVDVKNRIVYYQEQTHGRNSAGGAHPGVLNAKTFAQLFSDGYVPFTIPEFAGKDSVEQGSVTYNKSGASITASDLLAAQIDSDYMISDVTVILSKGSETAEYYYTTGVNYYLFSAQTNSKSPVSLYSTDKAANLGATAAQYTPYADGTYTVTVKVRISTGAVFTVYNGTLTA